MGSSKRGRTLLFVLLLLPLSSCGSAQHVGSGSSTPAPAPTESTNAGDTTLAAPTTVAAEDALEAMRSFGEALVRTPQYSGSDYVLPFDPRDFAAGGTGLVRGEIVRVIEGPVGPITVSIGEEAGGLTVDLVEVTVGLEIEVSSVSEKPSITGQTVPLAPGGHVTVAIPIWQGPKLYLSQATKEYLEPLLGGLPAGTEALVAVNAVSSDDPPVVRPYGIAGVVLGSPDGASVLNIAAPHFDGSLWGRRDLDSIEAAAW